MRCILKTFPMLELFKRALASEIPYHFEQRLRRSLRAAAVHLAVEQQRIEDRPRVVARDMPHETHVPRLDVDFDH